MPVPLQWTSSSHLEFLLFLSGGQSLPSPKQFFLGYVGIFGKGVLGLRSEAEVVIVLSFYCP